MRLIKYIATVLCLYVGMTYGGIFPNAFAQGAIPAAASSPGFASSSKAVNEDFYNTLAKDVDEEAKLAIAASTTAVDMAKWAIVIIAGIITIIAGLGIKTIFDARQEAKDLLAETRQDTKDTIKEWKDSADDRLKKLVDSGNETIRQQISMWENQIEKEMENFRREMKQLKCGNFLAHFIAVAHAQDFLVEQLTLNLQVITDPGKISQLLDQRERAYREVVRDLTFALEYIDGSNEEIILEIVSRAIWRRQNKRHNISPANSLKSWIYLALAWVAKRRNNLPEAIRCANKSYELVEDDPETLYNLACYYALSEDPKAALEFLQKSLVQTPSFAQNAWLDDDFKDLRHQQLADFRRVAGPAPQ